jgi:hypothetical protein
VVQRLAALARRADEDLQLLARLGLADVFRQALGPQRALQRLFGRRRRRGRNDALAAAAGAKSSVWMLIAPGPSAPA